LGIADIVGYLTELKENDVVVRGGNRPVCPSFDFQLGLPARTFAHEIFTTDHGDNNIHQSGHERDSNL
jgi:hypothetical protein